MYTARRVKRPHPSSSSSLSHYPCVACWLKMSRIGCTMYRELTGLSIMDIRTSPVGSKDFLLLCVTNTFWVLFLAVFYVTSSGHFCFECGASNIHPRCDLWTISTETDQSYPGLSGTGHSGKGPFTAWYPLSELRASMGGHPKGYAQESQEVLLLTIDPKILEPRDTPFCIGSLPACQSRSNPTEHSTNFLLLIITIYYRTKKLIIFSKHFLDAILSFIN